MDWLALPAFLLLCGWAWLWGSWGGWESWGQCFVAFAILVGVPWFIGASLWLLLLASRPWKIVTAALALATTLLIFVAPYIPERRFIDAYHSVKVGAPEAEVIRMMKPVSNVEFEPKPEEAELMFGWSNGDGTTEDYATFSMKDGAVVEKDFQFGD
jgi:hypothetical protein